MTTTMISIEVDAETARTFAESSAEERRRLQLLLALRLRELTAHPARPLSTIMDEMGARAAGRGLTPEIVESLLHGE